MKQVKMKIWDRIFACQVGVVPCLDCSVLLGCDCPLLQQTVATASPAPTLGLQTDVRVLDLPFGEGELAHLTEQVPYLCHGVALARDGGRPNGGGPWFQLRKGLLCHLEWDSS